LKEGTDWIYTYLMETIITPTTFDFCETMTDAQDALAREMLERVAAKWPLSVMHKLAEANGPLRFSRLLERAEGISQKVLTQTLRALEKDGLVTRTLYPQVPPRVEYELTPLGAELLVQVVTLWQWIAGHLPQFEAARNKADAPTTDANRPLIR
jgi:DNA-binding HxlR family transcriptional regulator